MNIDFNDTRPANALAATLFEVVIDDPTYPSFNSAVTNQTEVGLRSWPAVRRPPVLMKGVR